MFKASGLVILGVSIFLGVSTAHAADKEGLYLFVTPKGTARFHCRISTTAIREVEEMGQTPFRVDVLGAAGPFTWRLPLYQGNNGNTRIATNQVGRAKADANHAFVITVPTAELARVDARTPLSLEVTNRDGQSAACQTVLAPVAKNDPAFSPKQAVTR